MYTTYAMNTGYPDRTGQNEVTTVVSVATGDGNTVSATTTMPSSPETTAYDPTTATMPTMITNTSSVASTGSSSNTIPVLPITEEVEDSPPTMMLSSSKSTDVPPTSTINPIDRSHHHHLRHDSLHCTGLSALIQAATSQLAHLAEIASSEYVTQKDDVVELLVPPTQVRRASFRAPSHPPTAAAETTASTTFTASTTGITPTTWNDSLPAQLMKLILSSSDSTSSQLHISTGNMISFLPNGKYFVVRMSSFTQYLQEADHSLYHKDDPMDDKNNHHLQNDNVSPSHHETEETLSNNNSTAIDSVSPKESQPQTPDRRTRPRTRIRNFHDFVHTLLYRYNFTWIDHRYLLMSSNIASADGCDHEDSATISIEASPLTTTTIYPEIMVFRHEYFMEQDCTLCQQIPYCGESRSSLQVRSKDSSNKFHHRQQKNRYKRHDRLHSKVVHNHHAMVASKQQQEEQEQPQRLTSSLEPNDPTTVSTSTKTVTPYEAPSSPTVVEGSSTITKRRLSPGFLQQQEQKNGVTTSKQKVKIDMSDVANSVMTVVTNVTDESTRTSSFAATEDCDATTTATANTSAAAVTTENSDIFAVIEGTDSSTNDPATTSIDNEARKLSSGCESDMTNTTSQTRSSIVTTKATGITEMPDNDQNMTEDTTATMIRNIAITIANNKLQLPITSTPVGSCITNANDTVESSSGVENGTADSLSSFSELVEVGITTCTKEIVISAIESLLYNRSHSYEVYQQNLQELSKSSLPNLIPICRHIFETDENHSGSVATMTTNGDVADIRTVTAPSSMALSSVTSNTVTPETTISNEASSSSLIRVITTGSDGEPTTDQHIEHNVGDPSNDVDMIHPHVDIIHPRTLNVDSTCMDLMASTESITPPQAEIRSSTRVTTRRMSAKGNAGTPDTN